MAKKKISIDKEIKFDSVVINFPEHDYRQIAAAIGQGLFDFIALMWVVLTIPKAWEEREWFWLAIKIVVMVVIFIKWRKV